MRKTVTVQEEIHAVLARYGDAWSERPWACAIHAGWVGGLRCLMLTTAEGTALPLTPELVAALDQETGFVMGRDTAALLDCVQGGVFTTWETLPGMDPVRMHVVDALHVELVVPGAREVKPHWGVGQTLTWDAFEARGALILTYAMKPQGLPR